jgi:uncharacterized protein YndB with AHSA1/START domain
MANDTPEGVRILGTLRSEGGVGVVRIEERFDAAIGEVWSALTEPARLAQWYGNVEGDLRLGGEFRSHVFASGWEGAGRITACEPPHRLAVVSKEPDAPNENASEVTLTAEGDQTVVVYESRGMPVDLLFAYGAGEQIHVEDLGAHLAGRERAAAESRWDALESAYRPLAEQVGPQR